MFASVKKLRKAFFMFQSFSPPCPPPVSHFIYSFLPNFIFLTFPPPSQFTKFCLVKYSNLKSLCIMCGNVTNYNNFVTERYTRTFHAEAITKAFTNRTVIYAAHREITSRTNLPWPCNLKASHCKRRSAEFHNAEDILVTSWRHTPS